MGYSHDITQLYKNTGAPIKIGGSGKNQAGLPPFWRGRKPPATRPRALWQIFPVSWVTPGQVREASRRRPNHGHLNFPPRLERIGAADLGLTFPPQPPHVESHILCSHRVAHDLARFLVVVVRGQIAVARAAPTTVGSASLVFRGGGPP